MAASPIFVQRLVVEDRHIDELGHVSNLEYIRWILQAATDHSRSVGFDLETYRESGGVFMVRRHEIDYRGSARLGDELEIRTWIESWRGASSVRATSIVRIADEMTLCTGKTLWAYVALESQRPRRIPKEILTRFTTRD